MSATHSALHEAARKLASDGVPVFPCWPESKVPYTKNGFHDATTDLEIIDEWWRSEPRLNVAYCPHLIGLAVIDLDGDEGEAAWEAWQEAHTWMPFTYTVRTPRGGRHLYFNGVLPPTQSKLGVHVDTRGVGSYVLAPPSHVKDEAKGIDGHYTVIDPRPAADLPDEVGEYLRSLAKEKVKAAVAEMDLPQNVSRAKAHLRNLVATGRVAVEFHGGDKATLVAACDCIDLGCSPETTFELMRDIYNPACLPPWEENELEVKVQNAARYKQNEAGAFAVPSSEEAFGEALGKLAPGDLEGGTDERKGESRFKRRKVGELMRRPPPEWLLPDLMPSRGVSVLYGQPGTLKTFVAVEWCCTLASLGLPVLYVAAEGAIGVSHRVGAWCLTHGIDDPDTLPLEIVEAAPAAAERDELREFMDEAVMPFKPILIVIDTLARTTAGLDENSARDMGRIVDVMNQMSVASRAAVLVVHHSGKDGDRGPRGSGALIGGVEAMFEATRPDRTKPFVQIKCTRQKDAPEREDPWQYRGQMVGKQMVMQECSSAEFHDATRKLPPVRIIDLEKALTELGCVGPDESVGQTTDVVADKLAENLTKTLDEKDAMKAAYATVLGRGLGGLHVFSTETKHGRMWWMPPVEETVPGS